MKTTLITTLLLLSLSTAAFAQEPMPPQSSLPPVVVVEIDGKAKPIQIQSVATRVRILGAIAETRMTMTFRNPHARDLEGDLYFPLPEGATVSRYALDIQGRMVDGVAVTKEKARRTFEKEVRKGIDPGIIEWTRGNVFKARIFPLPARGTRTIMVGYVSAVVDTQQGARYQLPLNFAEKVGEFSLAVEVVKSGAVPVVTGQDLPDFVFAGWNEGFRAETTVRDAVLNENLTIALPPVIENPVIVERDARGIVRFVVTERVMAPETEPAPAPERMSIFWDASGSRGQSDHRKEISFLRRYLETCPSTAQASLTIFRDRAEPEREIALSAAGLDELESILRKVHYDGGTQLASIAPRKDAREADLILLFTDGISTFGRSDPGSMAAPVYVINSSTMSDSSFMRSLARRTGGRYIDLKRTAIDEAVLSIGRPVFSFLGATAVGAEIVEGYPSMPEPVNGRFLFTGVLKANEAEIILNFGVHGVTHSKAFTIKANNAVEGDLLRRFWAQKKLADLLVAQKHNESEITRLGREHGLVTPFTSLIVLETLEQYLEHEILPPATLEKMRDEYIDVVENRRREAEQYQRSRLARVVELWQARVAWWERKFKVPEDFKYRPKEESKLRLREEGMDSGGGPPPSAPAPSAGAAPEEESADEDDESGGFGFSDADGKKDEGEAPQSEPAIVLSSWDPKTPYLKALQAAPRDRRFAVYMAAREKYRTSPAFFLDCADFFFREKEEQLGIQILSNIAEMELESAPLLRILGHRLAQSGYLDLSIMVFEVAKKLRPEEPQSYRDLGLVLAERGSREDLERAVELLYHVVLTEWDRFDEIELMTLGELNQVIPKARAAGVKRIPVDPRLIKPLPLDIRIVMTWDADLTDMDLHVIEPSSEEAYYSHNRTTIGGLVSKDFTQGYGPEEYLLKKAMHGRYIIKTKFYGSSAAKMIGAVTLHVRVYTNYGRPNQQVQSMTLRLTGEKEMFVVGEIEF